jgi:tRNA (guanine37-N1)-methyltransferase
MLPEGMIVPSAFETVGHIAHLNLREEHLPYKKLIAKVLLLEIFFVTMLSAQY